MRDLVRIGVLAVVVVALSGCQSPPPRPAHLAAMPASHDFGKVLVGTSATRTPGAGWKNDGERSTKITALELAGADAASFGSDPRTATSR